MKKDRKVKTVKYIYFLIDLLFIYLLLESLNFLKLKLFIDGLIITVRPF